jgi:hypothetical protein
MSEGEGAQPERGVTRAEAVEERGRVGSRSGDMSEGEGAQPERGVTRAEAAEERGRVGSRSGR